MTLLPLFVCRCLLSFFFPPQSLAPTWEKTASELKGKVNIAKVDCTTDGFVCQLFGVRGYPTLKLYVAPSLLSPVGSDAARNDGLWSYLFASLSCVHVERTASRAMAS